MSYFYSTENASNGKVVTLTIQDGAFVWNDLIAESMLPIRSVNIINKKILVTYLVDTLSKVKTFDLNGKLFLKTFSLQKQGPLEDFMVALMMRKLILISPIT